MSPILFAQRMADIQPFQAMEILACTHALKAQGRSIKRQCEHEKC